MSHQTSAIVWSFVLFTAGALSVAENIATAPPADAPGLIFGGRDFFDSPHWPPSFLVLSGLSAAAAWMVPANGFVWGLVACAPYFVVFTLGVAESHVVGNNQGLWPVGLLFLLMMTALPCLAAGVSRYLRHR
jgi:hypothetical protein